jgi:hypothetical protein
MRGLGVGTHLARLPNWDVDKLLPLLKQMGASIIRDDISWEAVEQTKGTYALPPSYQHWLDAVTGSGIKVLVILGATNHLYGDPQGPPDPQAYARYAAWMAQNLKGKVAAYEIWSEPENTGFLKWFGGAWNGRDDAPWIAKYGELVRVASAAIRQADPQAVILHNLEGPAWVYGLRRAPQDYALVDGVDVHSYPVRFPAETVPWGGAEIEKRDGSSVADNQHSLVSHLEMMSQTWPRQYLGHPLQCWVGESGHTTYSPLKDGYQAGFTLDAQAAYLVRGAITSLAHGVKAWCIYDFVDDGNDPHDQESNFGLVRDCSRNYQPKPAFYALQRLARLLGPDWQLIDKPPGTLQQANIQPFTKGENAGTPTPAVDWVQVDGPQVYWFRVGHDYVTILWKAGWRNADFNPPQGKITWEGAAAGLTVQAQDLVTGETLTAPLTRAGTTVTVSDLPVGGNPVAIRWIGGATGR